MGRCDVAGSDSCSRCVAVREEIVLMNQCEPDLLIRGGLSQSVNEKRGEERHLSACEFPQRVLCFREESTH